MQENITGTKKEKGYNGKKLRVCGVPWHSAHQYELAHLPFFESYDLLMNPYRYWADVHRKMPENMHEVPYYEEGKYDLAILHIDQQCIYNPEKGDRISKGRLYSEINDLIKDIPKIVINHMTPFHDKYDSDYVVSEIKRMVGDNIMVVNSYDAAKQWGWGNVITHGMQVDEWWDLPKEPRCITTLSPEGMDKAYRRVFLHTVISLLNEKGINFVWVGVDRKFGNFDDYRDFIGRSLVYFNPTWQSPRPRARTEAMLSGCCIVTTPYQDADTFIVDGENGFLTSKMRIENPHIMDSPEYTAKLITKLITEEPDRALEVGQRGKKTAQELFNDKVFADQWQRLLEGMNLL